MDMKLDKKSVGDLLGDGVWKVLEYAIGLAIVIGAWTLVTHTIMAFQGKGKCMDAILANHPEVQESSVEIDSFMTRTLDDHWAVGYLMQPKNIQMEEYTIICHFKGSSYDLNRTEFLAGDKIGKLKTVSVSNLHPKMWNWAWFNE